MKIAYLVPGSGGTFYCQNCLRDYALIRAIRKLGEEAISLPLYLPPYDEYGDMDFNPAGSPVPIFFGGISVYLREHIPLLRNAPGWLDRLFNHPLLLRYAAKQEGSTNPAALGSMTLSLLEGRKGHHHKEYQRLLDWLVQQEKPDLIHISNALLLGLAPEIKKVLNVPVVCSLQDEEPWIEAMPAPYNRLCWKGIADTAVFVDTFVATSAWYAERIANRIGIPQSRIQIIPLGVDAENLDLSHTPSFMPPTIGFLSRLNRSQGFDVLVEAFITLKREAALSDLRLRATGGCTPADRSFLDAIQQRLQSCGMLEAFDLVPEFNKQQREAFLQTISVLSVPIAKGEAFGLHVIEALAQGVPVAQPRVGAYVETLEATGGGLLYNPRDPNGLVDALRILLTDPVRAIEMGKQGRKRVIETYSMAQVAQNMQTLYQGLIGVSP